MKNNRARLCGVAALFATLVISVPVAKSQGNSVVVESKHVAPGQTGVRVGIYVSNDVPIAAIILPLEIRTEYVGQYPYAYYSGNWTRQLNPQGRVYSSPLGPGSGYPGTGTINYYLSPAAQTCSGPISRSYTTPSQQFNPVTPDGMLFTAISSGDSQFDPNTLAPGEERPGIDEPSFWTEFDVNSIPGRIIIDTCCVTPSNHLSFLELNSNVIVPSFTKGIITVGTPPENSVVVESKEVAPGTDSVFVGVWISNAIDLHILTIPFEFRSVDPGAFTSGYVERGFNPAGRLYHTPIGPMPNNSATPASITQNYYPAPGVNSCSGPVSSSYSASGSQTDDISPDGYLLRSVAGSDANVDPCEAVPGSELQGTAPPSYYFRFDVSDVAGDFEIDTCCVGPANHLSFLDCSWNATYPEFTKGIISIGCFCRCHGDPDCNGYLDIVDVVRTVNTAFRGLASITDQDCTHARTDVDANAMTNVLDVARMIDVVFGGELQDDVFVDPCAN